MAKPVVIQPGRRLVKDPEVQQALDDVHTAILPHTRAQQVFSPAFGTTVTCNIGAGNVQTVFATNSQPFHFAAPIGVGLTSKHVQIQPNVLWTLVIFNNCPPVVGQKNDDGVLRPSFDASFDVAPFVSPPVGGTATAQFVTITQGVIVRHHQVGAWSTSVGVC